MVEINYEKEYDNRARVPEHPQIFARWATDAESYRASLSSPQLDRVNYGPTTREGDATGGEVGGHRRRHEESRGRGCPSWRWGHSGEILR
jgi:hypothetical protein